MERLPLLCALVLLRWWGVVGWSLEGQSGGHASRCPEDQRQRPDGPGEWSTCRPAGASLPATARADRPRWLPDGALEGNASGEPGDPITGDPRDPAYWGYMLIFYLLLLSFLTCCCCALAARSRPCRRQGREWFRLRQTSPFRRRPQDYGAVTSTARPPAGGQDSTATAVGDPSRLLASVPAQEAAVPSAGARQGTEPKSVTDDTTVEVEVSI